MDEINCTVISRNDTCLLKIKGSEIKTNYTSIKSHEHTGHNYHVKSQHTCTNSH
jgi:hypothetical protein